MTRLYFMYRYWTDPYWNRYTPCYQFQNAYKDWAVLFDANMKCEVIPEQHYKELVPWTWIISMDRVWYLDINETKLPNQDITVAQTTLQQIWTNYFLRIVDKTAIDDFVSNYTNLTVEESGRYLVSEQTVENPTEEQIQEWENDPNVEYVDNWNWTYTVKRYIII